MAFVPRKFNSKLTANAVEVVNKVREFASVDYKNAIPYATNNGDVLRQIGAVLYDMPVFLNEFATTLYNQIGFTWFSSNLFWKNPWTFAERGVLEQGEIVQEIYVGLCRPHKFDPALAESHWMKREVPDVRTAFHPVNYRMFYKSTISRDSIQSAFTSVSNLDTFISEVIGQMILSAEYDQFHALMYLYAKGIYDGIIPTIEVPDADSVDDLENIATILRSISNQFTFMSPNYTISGVKSATPKERQHLIINSDFEAEFDVKVLANAFNMEKADYLGNRVLSPGFENMDVERLDMLFGYLTFNEQTEEWETTPQHADEGYHHFTTAELETLAKCYALLSDKDFWQCYMKLSKSTTSPENGEGLYYNNWYHVWQTLGFSPFKNAVAFVGVAGAVSAVALNMQTATLVGGADIKLTATVSRTGFAKKSVTWSTNDSTIATVDDGGNVHILPTAQPNDTVTITAKSVVNPLATDSCTITIGEIS